MHIIWHGQAYFQIITAQQKGEQTVLCIDPFSKEVGLHPSSVSANICLITHDHYDHNNKQAIQPARHSPEAKPMAGGGSPFFIEGPGEYEIRGIFIQGISSWHDDSGGKERGSNTIYTIEAEEMRLCHLGDFGQKELSDEQLVEIGDVDVLFIPVGGVYTIDGAGAVKIISQIEPRIVIPMHYAIPKLKVKLDGADKFLKAMGVKSIEPQPKLLIKKKDLPQEETKVVLLEP